MVDKSKIVEIESEIKRACKVGHFISFGKLRGRSGVEIVLPSTVDGNQALIISKYFQQKYGFQSCFFVKRHAINVFYEE
jgi:hypothetical protein